MKNAQTKDSKGELDPNHIRTFNSSEVEVLRHEVNTKQAAGLTDLFCLAKKYHQTREMLTTGELLVLDQHIRTITEHLETWVLCQ